MAAASRPYVRGPVDTAELSGEYDLRTDILLGSELPRSHRDPVNYPSGTIKQN